MTKLKKLKFVIVLLSFVLAGIYLTFLIDTFTLNTWLKRGFVFCYFVIASYFMNMLYGKFIKHKITLIPLLCAIRLVALVQNVFLPTKAEHTVYVQAADTTDGDKVYKEVWFVCAEVDGVNKDLSKLGEGDCEKWNYSSEFDDYSFLPSENDETNLLSFTVVGNKIVLTFGANTWSGAVHVFDGKGFDKVISLYSENVDEDSISVELTATRTYSIFERVAYSAGAAVVVCFVFKVLIGLVWDYIGKKKKVSAPEGTAKS